MFAPTEEERDLWVNGFNRVLRVEVADAAFSPMGAVSRAEINLSSQIMATEGNNAHDDDFRSRPKRKDKGHEPPLEELKEEKIGDTEASMSPRHTPRRGIEGPNVSPPKEQRKAMKITPRNSLSQSQKWQRNEDSGLSGIMESSEKQTSIVTPAPPGLASMMEA